MDVCEFLTFAFTQRTLNAINQVLQVKANVSHFVNVISTVQKSTPMAPQYQKSTTKLTSQKNNQSINNKILFYHTHTILKSLTIIFYFI